MKKIKLLLFLFFISIGLSNINHKDLVWRSSIFKPSKIKNGKKNCFKKIKTISKKQNFSKNKISLLKKLNYYNNMRIKGVINENDYKRKKGTLMKTWYRYYSSNNIYHINDLLLLEQIHIKNGFNNYEYKRLKKYLMR